MSLNSPQDFALRLYSRIPSQYRVLDEEQGKPLLALMEVIGEQAANLRQDLDDLWDSFFIETCSDWVVPYIGALLGANLLAQPVGQSNRLDVRNTVLWRRSKGAPRMLEALATAISEWPTNLAEFFQMLGWSQNMNHLRLDHPLTALVRDPYAFSLLGRAADPFAHNADFKPARTLDAARVTPQSLGIGRSGWGTPGRYQIRNLGFFMRRLRTFPVNGATPASELPGIATASDAAYFTFNPLFREVPLFIEKTWEPLTRAALGKSPWTFFGKDVAVRQWGVLLAQDTEPELDLSNSNTKFTFGGRGTGLTLHATQGLRLMDRRAFQPAGGVHFLITAEWAAGGTPTALGSLSTFLAASGAAGAYQAGAAAPGGGQLAISVEVGHPTPAFPGLGTSPPARFPGATIAVRAANTGAPLTADALYVYLPPSLVTAAGAVVYFVADDGSTYTTAGVSSLALARAAAGQVYPPRVLNPSTAFADEFTVLNRRAGGLRLPDPTRFNNAQALVEVNLFTGTFQSLGAIATVNQSGASYPDLDAPGAWPAFTYAPSKAAMQGNLHETGLLSVRVTPLAGSFVPAFELVVVNRSGQSLLVYVPESSGVGAQGKDYFVADDGSTYDPPPDRTTIPSLKSYSGLALARASAGQVLPIAGVFPLQQRSAVALNLCRTERRALLFPGELGIDPELGRFAFAPGDAAIGQGGLTVDYVEAFSDRTGAHNFDRQLDPKVEPTILVSASGDASSSLTNVLAGAPVFTTLAAALAAAQDGAVIEIVDSSTYRASSAADVNNPAVKQLTVRAAAGQRPCLTFYAPGGAPTAASLRVSSPMDRLELNGLLISGGPMRLNTAVKQLALIACTLDPRVSGFAGSLIAIDEDQRTLGEFLLCRCISGGIRVGAGVTHLTVADSILDQPRALVIGGLRSLTSPPDPNSTEFASTVQLERTTVLGRVRAIVLQASECLLDEVAIVEDQQTGCIRYSRYELGSVLPRRFQCVPTEEQARAAQVGRVLPPLFHSRRFDRPDYAQLAAACPPEILAASEARAEVGAFAGALNAVRARNLAVKLTEFAPVGLSAVLIAET